MQVNEKRVSPVLMELDIQVSLDTVKTELEKAYVNLARKAHVKGFRPGKAPRNILTRVYGRQVLSDVANTLINSSLAQALAEKNMNPVSQPSVEVTGTVTATAPLVFKATFEVTPDITEVVHEGFALSRPSTVVSDAMVDEEIEGLRLRHAALKTPEPARGALSGDVATIDFTLAVNGIELPEGSGTGVQLELGTGPVPSSS